MIKKYHHQIMFSIFRSELYIEREGNHTLKLWMVDPGAARDKIIIDADGVKESCLDLLKQL